MEAAPIPFEAIEIITPKPIKEYAEEKAHEYGISWTKLNNLITYESQWNPNATNGRDRGLVQINSFYHPTITDEQAYDPYWAIDWAANEIKDGREHQWVVCNCFLLVKSKLGQALPKMAHINPNSDATPGSVAIFYYKGIKHVAYVTDVFDTYFYVFEANKEPCKIGTRRVDFTDPNLVGFFFPG